MSKGLGLCMKWFMRTEVRQRIKPAWWKVAPGVTWIQCHDPATVDRVRKLKGARLVARGVNVYLRIYEIGRTLGWVSKLMSKPSKPPPNEAFLSANGLRCGRKAGGVSW